MAEGKFSLQWKHNIDLTKVGNLMANAAEHASRTVAETWLEDSRNYVPVLTGALKDSGYVERVRFKSTLSRYVYQVVYDKEYATAQHEEEFNHPSLGFFGKAKYLSKPFEQNKAFYMELFAKSMKRFIERRTRS